LKRLVSKTYSDTFKFPIIAKATGGTRGGDNYLVESLDQLEKILASQNRQFIIQEYIPNNCDYRYFIADRLRGVIKRSSSGESHLNNTSKGGAAELVDINSIDPILKKQAVQASLIFNRNVAGVDIMHSEIDGKPYFLEVNRAPQIEGASFEDEKANWLVDAIYHKIENFMPAASVEKFNDRLVIGRFEKVKIKPNEFKVLAKIDTGADSSSLHCKDINLVGDYLECTIEGYHFKFKDYSMKKVKSSSGHVTERYMVIMSVGIRVKARSWGTTWADISRHCRLWQRSAHGLRFLRQIAETSTRIIKEEIDLTNRTITMFCNMDFSHMFFFRRQVL
jgi:hypothetical protein